MPNDTNNILNLNLYGTEYIHIYSIYYENIWSMSNVPTTTTKNPISSTNWSANTIQINANK